MLVYKKFISFIFGAFFVFLLLFRNLTPYYFHFLTEILPINSKYIYHYSTMLGFLYLLFMYNLTPLKYRTIYIIFGILAFLGEDIILRSISEFKYTNVIIILLRGVSYITLRYIIYKNVIVRDI